MNIRPQLLRFVFSPQITQITQITQIMQTRMDLLCYYLIDLELCAQGPDFQWDVWDI